ncbi:LmbE-like protein [Cystobacter fuscus DSM 2262]|uniref:LmbE-like protein n=1 Tax=Cystobacter fuscus (strain ATCC 25194 / DSM 2262 / NBRC 100088 / M29) TaxID=1242864 RepID=S9QUC3_CYSF2|nr:PIG-L family deacetylase [Cystobacter fuscus]EPX60238.1 LmbE-like protein [Cystobacter fuscus DSM 2262]
MWPPDESQQQEPREGEDGVAGVLGALLPAQALRGSTLFVTAHPDDTVRGASWLLRRSPHAHVVHITPSTPESHAPLPEQASFEALSLAGLGPERLLFLGTMDRTASQELVTLTECLVALLKALRPTLLVVHPYEGGHPDHDAAAFISHAAVALLVRGGRTPPSLLEMAVPTCGHLGPHPIGFQSTRDDRPVATVALSAGDRALKQRMLACHASPGWDSGSASSAPEHYRLAPRYDFTRPPHAGRLLYEVPTPGMTAVRWRQLARRALEQLKLTEASAH